MTKFHWQEPETTADRIARFDRYKLQNENEAIRRADARNRAKGILPHNDSDDPWSETEFRRCEPGCYHQQKD